MTDWTEETKSQAPHWKSEDITDRTISRNDIESKGTTTRGDIATYIHGVASATVTRLDMENVYGSKEAITWTEESKTTISWTEESK
jgi:hypothetical protein